MAEPTEARWPILIHQIPPKPNHLRVKVWRRFQRFGATAVKEGFFNTKGVSIPVAVSVFPGEQYEAPRSWTERAYPKFIHYNRVAMGGHFAAWEQPGLFSIELRLPSGPCVTRPPSCPPTVAKGVSP